MTRSCNVEMPPVRAPRRVITNATDDDDAFDTPRATGGGTDLLLANRERVFTVLRWIVAFVVINVACLLAWDWLQGVLNETTANQSALAKQAGAGPLKQLKNFNRKLLWAHDPLANAATSADVLDAAHLASSSSSAAAAIHSFEAACSSASAERIAVTSCFKAAATFVAIVAAAIRQAFMSYRATSRECGPAR